MTRKNGVRWAIRGMLATMMAALLLQRVLTKPHPQGFLVRPITTECDAARTDGYRDVQLSITAGHGMRVNMEEVSPEELYPLLQDVYKARVRKVLFVDASEGLPLQVVVDVMARARQAVPDLEIVLVGPGDREGCAYTWRSVPGGGAGSPGAY